MKMEATEFEKKQKISQLSHKGLQHIEHGTPENAVDCFLNAYQLSRQLEDDHLERTCALNVGAAYIESQQAREGLKFLHKAVPPDGEKDGISIGDLFYDFALGLEATNNLKKSAEYYWKASSEFRTDPDMQIQCLTKCARLYSERKEYPKVIEVYGSMCDVYKTQNDSVMQAFYLCEIASFQRQARNDLEAKKAADEAYEMLSKICEDSALQKTDLAGKVLNDLGLAYTQLQNYDMATSCFEKALPLVRAPVENKQLEAVILQNLGAAYNFRGEYQRAIKVHEDAADAYARIKSRSSQGQCFTNLAFAYSRLGNIEDADVAFNHALLASKEAGDRQTRWQALEGLGCVKFNQGKYDKAESFFLDALRLIPESDIEVSERVKQKLAQVMEMKFMSARHQSARYGHSLRPQRNMSRTMETERPQNLELVDMESKEDSWKRGSEGAEGSVPKIDVLESIQEVTKDGRKSTKPPTLPTTQSAPHTSGFSSGDVGTYLKPSSPQGKPYGTDDMAPYLDSGVIPAFYHTGYTPVPNDNIPGASHIHSDPSKDSKNPGAGPTGESNLPFSSSNNTEDPNTLYSTVDKTKKTKEQTAGFQSSGNGNPDIRVEKPQKQKKKRKKSGNYFDSDDSISGEDIDTTNKMKEVASNMSLRGSIKPGSGDEEDPYQSINDVTREPGDFQHDPDQEAERFKGIDDIPRGQRDAILSKEHMRRSELGPPLPERGKQAKESKTCVVM